MKIRHFLSDKLLFLFLGSLIIFVAFLSVGFLHRKIKCVEWIGIIFVISGLIIVGVSDFLFNSSKDVSANNVLTGMILFYTSIVFYRLKETNFFSLSFKCRISQKNYQNINVFVLNLNLEFLKRHIV